MTGTWRAAIKHLPITQHLAPLCEGIASHTITLVEAPPGTGKTTVLPLALLDEPALAGKNILILQPRRIAAKSVATRMADLLGEPVGSTVGYSVRLESKRSKQTRIEVITEGLLTRRLISDPELSGVGAIIFDEFHERSIHADVGLALTLEAISVLRPDLKAIIMSATLGEALPTNYLTTAWRYAFEGTTFPVTVLYEPGDVRQPIWDRVATAVKGAAGRFEGDVLAFLPGSYEIQRTQEVLERSRFQGVILPLFGYLPFHEQVAALHPDPQGRRKIVLATTIAETSLTIEGIRVVVDSGVHKVARSDPQGFSSLTTESITRDAADQRAGRAGRTTPGTCIRLWSEQEQLTRRLYREPEVLRADLTSPILDLAAWGVPNPASFSWITPPPRSALEAARETLRQLRAIADDGTITHHGRSIASLGAHPRLGMLACSARTRALESLAAQIITLLEERDIIGPTAPSATIHTRLDTLSRSPRRSPVAHRMSELSERWHDRIRALPSVASRRPFKGSEDDAVALLVASAFPERIARRREEGSHRYLLASGKGASLKTGDPLRQSEFIVACSVQETGGELAIRLAAPLSPELFKEELSHLLTTSREVRIDEKTGALASFQLTRVGAITISSKAEPKAPSEEIAAAFGTWLSTEEGWAKVSFGESTLSLLARVRWARARQGDDSTLPDLSTETLRSTVSEWLLPLLSHPPKLKEIDEHIVHQAVQSILPWALQRELDAIAPASITLPSGRSRPLTYPLDGPPHFEARIQDLFGLVETPRIGRFHVPATIRLLSPAHRPVQVTQDLANFWRVGYPVVRKELRGRYPKHKWPENPLEKSG
jgi:ATP-dependent helicase HrpB